MAVATFQLDVFGTTIEAIFSDSVHFWTFMWLYCKSDPIGGSFLVCTN